MIKVCDYGLGLEACVLALASALANMVFITSLELDGRVWSLFSYLVVFSLGGDRPPRPPWIHHC